MAKKQTHDGKDEAAGTVTATRYDEPRKDANVWAVYDLPGGGRVCITRSRMPEVLPESITLGGVTLIEKTVARAKMTDEERKAAAEARKNETPAQKAERAAAIAKKATERANKLAEAAKIPAPEQTVNA